MCMCKCVHLLTNVSSLCVMWQAAIISSIFRQLLTHTHSLTLTQMRIHNKIAYKCIKHICVCVNNIPISHCGLSLAAYALVCGSVALCDLNAVVARIVGSV